MTRSFRKTVIRYLTRAKFALVASCIAGCSFTSLSPLIKNNALDYNRVVEDFTNNIMVTNILRARDRAPLHYSDIGSIQVTTTSATAAQAIFPILAPTLSTTPGNVQLGSVSLTNAPLVNVATLDTDDFIRGITTPITGDTIKHFLDEGLDPRVAMLLFFDGIKGYQDNFRVQLPSEYVLMRSRSHKTCPYGDNETHYCINISAGEKVMNDPDNNEFWKYLTIVNYEYYGLYANEYRELQNVGRFAPSLKTALKDVTAPDPAKIQLASDGTIYAVLPDTRVMLCRSLNPNDPYLKKHEGLFEHAANRIPATTNDHFRIFSLSEIAQPVGQLSTVCTSGRIRVRSDLHPEIPILYPRSPQGMIEFLGALLRLQRKEGRVITVGVEPSSGALFSLSNNPAGARFTVTYHGESYYVKEANSSDHTLEVLALLNQMLDLYKSAKDVPRFPAITVAP
jgi:hypothetical protein